MQIAEGWTRDVRHAGRSLARTPGFSLLAILSLGVGLMASTAIYSVLYAVVLHPFPYRDVDSLASVLVSDAARRGGRVSYSVDQFLEIAERSTIFDGVIASTISDVLWVGQGEPLRLRGNYGTVNTFDVMGVPPLVGRTPDAADAAPGAAPVVVLGYRFWQRQFGGDPGVLGRQLFLDGTSRTVIGVMPTRFMWRGADVYLPLHFQRGRIEHDVRVVHLLGRVKPGVTAARAAGDLRPIIADLRQREPNQFPETWRVGLLSFAETFPSGIRREVWVLFAAVSLLLLIACANVSNLLLSRAAARRREIAIRVALGASRGRIVRQLLAESLLLALVAGSVGTLLAWAGLPALLSLVPPGTIPDEAEIALNVPVLLFALAVSVLTSVVCGLVPALHGRSGMTGVAMRETSRGVVAGGRGARLRSAFLVVEVALALVLLVGCSLLVRAMTTIYGVPLSVDPGQVLTLRVPLSAERYPDAARRAAFVDALVERVAALPGVIAAGANTGLHPLGNLSAPAVVDGLPASSEPVTVHQVSAGYAAAAGLRLTAGRALADADVRTGRHVAVVNERFVRARLEGRAALGAIVRIPRLKQPPVSLQDDGFEIVGVVADTPNRGLDQPVAPELVIPHTLAGMADRLVLRTSGDAAAQVRAVSAAVHALDPIQPVDSVRTLSALLAEEEYATPRFNLVLFAVFSGIGLLLAVIGVYGVMSTVVAQQWREIGVRLALGAQRSQIIGMVVGRGARLLLAGVGLGLVGSIFAARAVANRIWNVPAYDPAAFGVVAAVLIVAGVQACFWPARRASRIDPIVVLRTD